MVVVKRRLCCFAQRTNFVRSGGNPQVDRSFNGSMLWCPSKLVSIRNWNRNQFRHYPKQNICFGCFASVPKQRVSMFRLNRNKQKTNRNSLIGSIFCYFLQNIQGFSGFFRFFQFLPIFFGLLRLFCFYTETESFDVLIEPKQTEDPPKQFKIEYIWVFFRKFRVVLVYFGLLRNSSVCFGCFDIVSKH